MGSVTLVLCAGERGGVLPRNQELPRAAFITPSESWRLRLWPFKDSLPVLVLSYPWLDRWHPDRLGEQLSKWLPIFKLMLHAAKSSSAHATVGVLWDFGCLPQKPHTTVQEGERFEISLRAINEWFFHPYTIVLLVSTPPPSDHGYTNTRPYKGRGWCNFELNASITIKNDQCLWDMSQWKDGIDEYGWHGGPAAAHSLVGTLKAGRQPPLTPDAFSEQLHAGVECGDLKFTAPADVDIVVEQYRRGFANVWGAFSELTQARQPVWFEYLGWTDADGALLLEALKYAAMHCTFVSGPLIVYCVDGNEFSEGFLSSILQANEGALTGKFVCTSGWRCMRDFPEL